jgi:hypothetical protein
MSQKTPTAPIYPIIARYGQALEGVAFHPLRQWTLLQQLLLRRNGQDPGSPCTWTWNIHAHATVPPWNVPPKSNADKIPRLLLTSYLFLYQFLSISINFIPLEPQNLSPCIQVCAISSTSSATEPSPPRSATLPTAACHLGMAISPASILSVSTQCAACSTWQHSRRLTSRPPTPTRVRRTACVKWLMGSSRAITALIKRGRAQTAWTSVLAARWVLTWPICWNLSPIFGIHCSVQVGDPSGGCAGRWTDSYEILWILRSSIDSNYCCVYRGDFRPAAEQ